MQNNPFPGMNPWLESHWGDMHTSLTTYARDHLQPQLPAGLRARIEEYVAVESDEPLDGPRRRFAPDVRVIERPDATAESEDVATSVATMAEPLLVLRRSEPETLHTIQIVDATAGHRIVTSIEFLSLANKVSDGGRQQFQTKQRHLLAGGVHLVEIDLLRAGAWVLAVSPGAMPKPYREPYRISVVRADRQSLAEVYRVSLREPLPTIRIPLRSEDPDVPLPLQTLVDTAYVNGRYQEDLDYTAEPRPPLIGPDADWADQLLRAKGLR
ncbi:MAG: DUF4058 family protein [Planctomycetota bacterium]|nr:DUF4058 family protein [Planctomycetota bacterium]